MNSTQLLREQFKSAHETLEKTIEGTPQDVSDFNNTNKALPVGAAYAHAVVSEDILLAGMIRHTTPISADNAITGLSEPMPSFEKWDQHESWAKDVKVDLAKFREYAQKVYAQTDEYLATLKEEDLDQEVDMGAFGKYTLAFVLTNFSLLHLANLAGEVSAAKGFQGHKGYPF